MLLVKVSVGSNGKLPTKGSPEAAAHDLYAAHEVVIEPNAVALVKLDIVTEMPKGSFALIGDRSGLATKGITTKIHPILLRKWYESLPANEPWPLAGVVDSDYRGEWGVVLANLTDKDYKISVGDRIAQVIFLQLPESECLRTNVKVVSATPTELKTSERGTGGLGSTGK